MHENIHEKIKVDFSQDYLNKMKSIGEVHSLTQSQRLQANEEARKILDGAYGPHLYEEGRMCIKHPHHAPTYTTEWPIHNTDLHPLPDLDRHQFA